MFMDEKSLLNYKNPVTGCMTEFSRHASKETQQYALVGSVSACHAYLENCTVMQALCGEHNFTFEGMHTTMPG